MNKFEFEVSEEKQNIRLDKFLADAFSDIKPEINRSKIQKLIEEELVLDANSTPVKNSSLKTKLAMKFFVTIPDPKPMELVAKQIDFEIIFEDDDLLVINKPANLTVHPGAGNHDDTLVNALLFNYKDKLSTINGEFRPGIVHRLDKDTTGLMLVAKNDFTHQILSKNLQERTIKRSYLAFIYGVMEPKKGKIDKDIKRHRFNRLKMQVTNSGGKNAITNYETKEIFLNGFASLLECKLETGRTHQIRVHLESMKHSIIGDKTYNSCKKMLPAAISDLQEEIINNFARQALHSYKIEFVHPRSEEKMSFETQLPDDLKKLEQCLKS